MGPGWLGWLLLSIGGLVLLLAVAAWLKERDTFSEGSLVSETSHGGRRSLRTAS
jgi:hypothetical protein